MGDQPIERQPPGRDQIADGGEVRRLPFGGDADARLAHEGGRKGKCQRLAIEAGQYDLTARREALDQRIEDRAVAAGVADDAIVAAGIVGGVDDVVSRRAAPSGLVALPHGRLVAEGTGKARQQPPQHAMTNDEIRLRKSGGRMMCGRGERQQDGVCAEIVADGEHAVSRDDDARGGAAEQAAHVLEAARAGNEDPVAETASGATAGERDAADRFVSGDQRIAHAREGRHAAEPQEPLGPGADAAPFDIDDHVLVAGRGQLDLVDHEAFGLLDDDREGFHDRLREPEWLRAILRLKCQPSLTTSSVK